MKLWEDNVFTPVCDSVHRGRCVYASMHWAGGVSHHAMGWGCLPRGVCPGGCLPGGVYLGWGVCPGDVSPGGIYPRGYSPRWGCTLNPEADTSQAPEADPPLR